MDIAVGLVSLVLLVVFFWRLRGIHLELLKQTEVLLLLVEAVDDQTDTVSE